MPAHTVTAIESVAWKKRFLNLTLTALMRGYALNVNPMYVKKSEK